MPGENASPDSAPKVVSRKARTTRNEQVPAAPAATRPKPDMPAPNLPLQTIPIPRLLIEMYTVDLLVARLALCATAPGRATKDFDKLWIRAGAAVSPEMKIRSACTLPRMNPRF